MSLTGNELQQVARQVADGLSGTSRGHYLDKDHWISVSSGQSITRSLVKELVKVSYELAREQLPKKDRPQ